MKKTRVVMRVTVFFLLAATVTVLADKPKVIKAIPDNGNENVAPTLEQIRIEFDQNMDGGGFSICGGGPKFPELLGKPRWLNKRTLVANVKLNPNYEYQMSINCPSYQNCKSVNGEPAEIYPIKFKTASAAAQDSNQPSKSSVVQELINSANAGDMVEVPDGVYTDPIIITKPLTLKGQSQAKCIFEVKANRPAIFINNAKGKVTIEDLTIKWQLATSDKTEQPFALGVKDSDVEVKNCVFNPLGNSLRSPMAVRANGFSKLTVSNCQFEGFEYVINYGDGTEGVVQDCLIADCGHQGIMVYSGAKVEVMRNVIAGSKYHAVRSTGGHLEVRDNLIINNKNRGVYLGNKSAQGSIVNNGIIGNGTGISGFASSNMKIENNVIADNNYSGVDFRDSCSFVIQNNIFQSNGKGWIMFKEGGKGGNTSLMNTFWQNKVDTENFDKTANSILTDPCFADFENGDFSLKPGTALENKQGLTNPEIIRKLWEIWEKYKEKK
ncbi:MAG TPA: hypothetical protein DDW84_05700 [Phycisphaerales bacterium]|nr:MAG: hypothetical protein A2Y13_09690 [Planctomycetes bacterium GWC2_45_44]HBG78328.1 hypothetical protein [Phycisphaerales bacterium]HBR20836.1 hypothetical protein [Phycisphaerales bacterium]